MATQIRHIDRKLETVERLVRMAAEGEVDHYAGKRREPRISEGVQLELIEDFDQKPVPISMHNISTTGCAFWIKRKLEMHTTLFVRQFTEDNSAPWIPGYVTHCTQGIRGHLVGVMFGQPA
jgi:hypothetical protein